MALTVLYDAGCGLCRRARAWLEQEPQFVELRFVAAGSAAARQRFPELDPAATLAEITVVGDDGAVYRGARAWLICLWALRDYREWSQRLAAPTLQPSVERFVHWVSANRLRLGGAPADACEGDTCRPRPQSGRG